MTVQARFPNFAFMAKPKRPRDTNQLAKFITDIATEQIKEKNPDEGKNPHAVALGRLGGLKFLRKQQASLRDLIKPYRNGLDSVKELTFTQLTFVEPDVNKAVRETLVVESMGDKTWKEYTMQVLNNYGQAKSSDIADSMIFANPDINADRIKRAVIVELSNLAKEGKINKKGKSRKMGFLFSVKV